MLVMCLFAFNARDVYADGTWTIRATDRFSGISLLGPADTDKLSLSDVRAYFTTRSCKIGGDMRVSMESYKGLDAIYIGGWYKSHSVGNAEARGHLLAFPAKGITETPWSLLNHIRDLFKTSGGSSYCTAIDTDHLPGETESRGVMYFEETLGVNGHGSSCYAAVKIEDYLYLAVLSSRSGAPTPSSFLSRGGAMTSLGMPDGEFMSPQGRSSRRRGDTPNRGADEQTDGGGSDWPQFLIGGVIVYGLFVLATRKK